MRAVPRKQASDSGLRTGDQGESCFQHAAGEGRDQCGRAAGLYRPSPRPRKGGVRGVAGEARMILPGTGRGTIRKANGGGGASLRKPEVYAARKLRRRMSPPEVLLWSQVRRRKLGFKVLRQHPIGSYSADFYIPTARLVIEIDG